MAGETQKIIVPINFLETAKELQLLISDTPLEARQLEAQKAVDLLGPTKEYVGTRTVLLHALSSYIVLESMDRVDVDTIPQDEMILRGNIGGITYLEDNFAMSSLCVAMRASTVLWRKEGGRQQGNRIDKDLYVPVFAVESMWAAA